jgi:sulfonate transport system ATP-binding protein
MVDINVENKVEVHDLTKKFGDLLVLDDISFSVRKNEFLCIVGPTGCGKTTFLNSLSKLYDITSGEILINKEPVNPRKHNLAYIFQEYSNFPWLTIQENVEYGLKVKRVSRSVRKEKADYFIHMVGLDRFRDYYPKQLSASMLQRAAIARAFAVEPELLLMDEPYGQLDIELRFRLEDELIRIWKEVETTVIFITHNIEEAIYLSERILVLTNKPTKIKAEIHNSLPRPRNIADPEFVKLRNEVTDLIKWW